MIWSRHVEGWLVVMDYFQQPLSWNLYLISEYEARNIQFAPNQMNKPGPFVEFYTDPAYSSGLAQTAFLFNV